MKEKSLKIAQINEVSNSNIEKMLGSWKIIPVGLRKIGQQAEPYILLTKKTVILHVIIFVHEVLV